MNDSIDPELEALRKKRIQKLIEDEEKKSIPALSQPVSLTTTNFEEFINEKPIVFVDFWADWCRPCKMVGPILDELASEYSGKVWVGKVNVDEQRQLAMKYGANSIPTFWAFKDGEAIQRFVGLKPKEAFKAIFDQLIDLDIDQVKNN